MRTSKKYELLVNPLYLFLLVNYDGKIKPTYVRLAQELGLARATVSKYFQKLIDDDVIDIDKYGFIYVFNPLKLDKEKINEYYKISNDNIYIAYLICKDKFPYTNHTNICDLLNISETNLMNHIRRQENNGS